MTSLLYINDNQLRLQHADGRILSSQGYAWIKEANVVFDLDSSQPSAAQQCRLSPQQINNRYWQQCDQSSIVSNAMGLRHAADLVWQHLSQLKASYELDELVLIVPSHYQESQLQLLLGIAGACELRVVALVNKAVAELSKLVLDDGEYRHVDVQLHQAVCSTVLVEKGEARLTDVTVLQDVGIHQMQEALLHGLQSKFIQDDRFDPLHDAATEQQLFNQLPEAATNIGLSGSANIGVEHQSRLHSISVESTTWDNFLNPFRLAIEAISSAALKVFVDLNGAFDTANVSGLNSGGFVALHMSGLEGKARFLIDHQDAGVVLYQTQLAAVKADGSNESESLSNESELDSSNISPSQFSPSHIVFAGRAVALEHAFVEHNSDGLLLSKKANGNLKKLLNDKKLFIINDDQRLELQVNDRVGSHLVDGTLTAIQVL
jgi:hypothetical protein